MISLLLPSASNSCFICPALLFPFSVLIFSLCIAFSVLLTCIFLTSSLAYFISSSVLLLCLCHPSLSFFFPCLLPPPLPAFPSFPGCFLFGHILQQHLTVSAGKANAVRAASPPSAGRENQTLTELNVCLSDLRGGGGGREKGGGNHQRNQMLPELGALLGGFYTLL